MSESYSSDSPEKRITSSKDWFRLICCGLCMGTADIIPGISGGTIAFIMGFYEELLNSIKSFNLVALRKLGKGQIKEFFSLVSWKFLLGLLIGIVLAMVCTAHFVTYVLNHEQYRVFLYALFLGLIIAATILCGCQIKSWRWSHFFVFIITACIAFILTGSTWITPSQEPLFDIRVENVHSSKILRNYDPQTERLLSVPLSTVSAMLAKGVITPSTTAFSHQDHLEGPINEFVQNNAPTWNKLDPWIIFCGALAICAMILPGISGSYLLSVLGMYATVVGALADFAGHLKEGSFDSASCMILVNMLIGIVLGALFFTRLVSWVLKTSHDLALASLTGFMIGALKSVWPFWSYQYSLLPLHIEKGPQLEPLHLLIPHALNLETGVALSLMICGGALVFGLHLIAQQLQKKQSHPS